MVNQSQKKDSRFLARWKDSGAIETYGTIYGNGKELIYTRIIKGKVQHVGEHGYSVHLDFRYGPSDTLVAIQEGSEPLKVGDSVDTVVLAIEDHVSDPGLFMGARYTVGVGNIRRDNKIIHYGNYDGNHVETIRGHLPQDIYKKAIESAANLIQKL